MGATSIEWVRGDDGSPGHSINPIKLKLALATGPVLVNMCTRCSPGCENCYSESMTRRFWPKAAGKFPGFTAKGAAAGEWVIDQAKLREVLRRRKPTRYFWCDMTDMFHPSVSFDLVDQCFAVMALTPHHTHMVLTKRPERMAEYASLRKNGDRNICGAAAELSRAVGASEVQAKAHCDAVARLSGVPLPNVWLGCSPVNQRTLEDYLPHLLRCQAAVRFLSLEPLLGPITLLHRIWCRHHECYEQTLCMDESKHCFRWQATATDMIDWIIVGGESGQNARPMHPDWARALRDQCHNTGVKFFFKQWGAWKPADEVSAEQIVLRFKGDDGVPPKHTGPENPQWHTWPDGWKSALVGKKAAGRQLDGREWNEMPKPAGVRA